MPSQIASRDIITVKGTYQHNTNQLRDTINVRDSYLSSNFYSVTLIYSNSRGEVSRLLLLRLKPMSVGTYLEKD